MNRLVIPLLFLSVFISGTNTAQSQPRVLTVAAPEAGGFSAERLTRLDSGMSDWVKKKWVNGSVALIARKGKIVFYKSYGYNDMDTKAPLDKNGIFRIASQTKAVTTVAAMILWEEGKFSLDDPVSKYIPTFANEQVLNTFNFKDTTYTTVPAKRAVTIRDLLSQACRDLDIRPSAHRRKMPFMQKPLFRVAWGVNSQKSFRCDDLPGHVATFLSTW